jgi:hypothetical protein
MKLRQGFVSNSSSSSFIIDKKHLSTEQIRAIKNHLEVGKIYFKNLSALKTELNDVGFDFNDFDKSQKYNLYDFDCSFDKYCSWDIEETDTEIKGCTIIDNFDMDQFLLLIGIEEDKVVWREY